MVVNKYMDLNLSLKDIDNKISKYITIQKYSNIPIINDVIIKQLQNYHSPEGDFCELFRLNEKGYSLIFPNFKIVQINRSKIPPKIVKAWHLHFKQDEIWYVSPSESLVVGLYDTRKKSSTCGISLKIILGEGKSELLYIPKGVAHGCVNLGPSLVQLFYFINNQFIPESPDENRLPWDFLGADFWEPKKD